MRKAALLAVTLPLLATPTPADAVRVRDCVSRTDVTFSPALTLDPHGGNIEWSYTNTCVVVYDNGASGVDTYSSSLTFGYNGSCATAVVSGTGYTGVLVGGTSLTLVAGPPYVRAGTYVLVPDSLNPCAMTSATVIGTGPDVLL